jgi:predicted transcriptional regulator
MWYHIKKVYDMQRLVMSDLQNSILKYIILNESVDYQIISKEVDRDRTTIYQSIESLTKKNLLIMKNLILNTKKVN